MPDAPTTDTEPLPVDWYEWRDLWRAWSDARMKALGPTCTHTWPRPSIMADEVIGRWHIDGRCVELSAVTMFPSQRTRHVGVAYRVSDHDTEPGPLCDTLDELEQALWVF